MHDCSAVTSFSILEWHGHQPYHWKILEDLLFAISMNLQPLFKSSEAIGLKRITEAVRKNSKPGRGQGVVYISSLVWITYVSMTITFLKVYGPDGCLA